MQRERVGRVVRAAVLVGVGIQGLASPVAEIALRGAMPDCVEASPVTAWAGTSTMLLAPSADCPHGSFAPTASYGVFTNATLVASVVATILGLVAVVMAVGLGMTAQRTFRDLRRWFVRRVRVLAVAVQLPSIARPVPVPVPVQARTARVASHPRVRRGPPSCSC